MFESPKRYLVLLYSIVVATALLDQITKVIARTSLARGESVDVLGSFLRWTLVYNQGGAFSTRLGPSLFYLLISVAIMVAVMIMLHRYAASSRLVSMALAFVGGGAIGNLIDRIYLGSVVDWIDFEFFDISIPPMKLIFWQFPGYYLTRWPVFNIADSAITVGLVLLIIHLLWRRKDSQDADPQIAG